MQHAGATVQSIMDGIKSVRAVGGDVNQIKVAPQLLREILVGEGGNPDGMLRIMGIDVTPDVLMPHGGVSLSWWEP